MNEPQVRTFALISRPVTMVVTLPDAQGRQDSRVEVYRHKSAILKQIMSNKARRYRRINAAQNIATVVASALLLFFGFSGLPKVQTWVSWVHPIGIEATELGFNLLVFLLFVVGVLHLVFHFPEKQSRAEKAIASLAALVNEIEDMVTTRGNLVISEDANKIALIGTRYEAAADGIPANSDREYQKAKADLARKEARRAQIYLSAQLLFDKAEHERIVSAIALGSRPIVDALLTLRNTSPLLYLGGGLVRNAVWDHLHGYDSPTPVDDVDVIYFDTARTDKLQDEEFDKALTDKTPNVKWSTKNQARMHVINHEEPYSSLEDAVSHWPETATATILRLKEDGTLEFIAPFGFDDLLRMVVTNTPAFAGRQDTIRERLTQKRWTEVWPLLKVWLPPPPPPTEKTAASLTVRKRKKGFLRGLLQGD